ncbi:hypothetical protein CU669_16225 [Paramagnetospirillum kuznetsovii]|uniref:Membrane transport protein MMPL domain-containing protein n=1 Tax=Paramagnetospirillum kuznetsovii TaxID=2053833 RepID=A0A364NUQ2_9PROT|nr:hypothetical protein [Paramagnetospirillum kuznetsovii]RAU20819.1 hypothetical protein CU669_16225 [Paramagnetospirillum kuznetsovii]
MRRVLALIWLLVVLAALGYVAVQSVQGLRLETDILALLPREDQDPVLQSAKDRMAQNLAGRAVILVGHPSREVARAEALNLRRNLLRSGLIKPNTDIPDQDAIRRLGAAYFPHRAGLLSEPDRQRLGAGQGEPLVTRALSQIFGFGGVADSRLLARDPFMLFPAFLGDLPVPANRLVMDGGMPSVADGPITWVLVSVMLAGEPYALDFQRRFVEAVQAPSGVALLRLGAVFFAQAGAEQATAESSRVGAISMAGTVLLVLLAFRSVGPLVLSVLAIGTGLLTALAACLWLFGSVHVAAQLFGASLIGISVDYALLYFGQVFTVRTAPSQRLKHVLPGLTLGMVTTVIGYGSLALSPFPGLKQVALLSAVGLIGSFLTVLLWFPLLDRAPGRSLNSKAAAMAAALWRFWSEARFQVARKAVLALLALLTVWGMTRIEPDDDVRRQQGLSPVLVAEQSAIQRLTGLGQNTRFFLVQGESEQQVLEREEALGDRLSGLTGWQSAARFVPSFRRQADNARLVQTALIDPHLAAYRARLGMAEIEAVAVSDTPLDLAMIRSVGALPILDSLILDDAMHAVILDGGADTDALRMAAQGLEGVRLIDPVGDISRLLEAYRHRALMLLAVSTVLMVPVLVWRYGRSGAVRVLAPALAAIIATPPLLALAGLGFSFFGAMALVLVLSIGTDYGVFCAEDKVHDPVTLVSVWLAMITTLLSFGLLALSDVAAVKAFGATMLVGVLTAFLLAPSAGRRP